MLNTSRPKNRSMYGFTLADRFLLVSGYALASRAASDANSACAASNETPGLRRPKGVTPTPSPRVGAQHVELEGHPDLLVHRELEARGHHADDGGGLRVDAQRAADDVRVALEAVLPDLVAEDRHARRAGRVVALHEGPAQQRFHAGDVERVGRDEGAVVALGPALAAADVDGAVVEGGEDLEGLLRVAPLGEVLLEDVPAVVVVRLGRVEHGDRGNPVGVGERQPPQERPLDDAEHRRRQPDAEREGEDGDGGQARLPQQRPGAVAEVGGN